MKLSIFPAAKSHPKTKEEKIIASYAVSAPNLPKVKTFSGDEELIQLVTSHSWSPFVFSGTRSIENFVSTDLLVYDIDKGLTIDAAEAIIASKKLCALCLPSPSHTNSAHRFRLILPLSHTIYNPQQYIDTWLSGAEIFGVVDKQCKDLARWYCGSTDTDGFWLEGALFEPIKAPVVENKPKYNPMSGHNKYVKVSEDLRETIKSIYGEYKETVSESVSFFLQNAHTGLPGEWICSLNGFCFSLSLSGVEEAAIMDLCEQLAPNPLDKRDLDQIKRSIRDGERRKVEEEL